VLAERADALEPLRVIEPEIRTRQISPPLITVQEEKSEKSRDIEMSDRKAQPSNCRMCKKTFPSRNSMFRYLTEQHQFYQENQQKSESMEEEAKKQFPVSAMNQTLLSCHSECGEDKA